MEIKCLFDKMVAVEELKVHPKNRNTHSDEQIKRLAEILEYQGWRYPIKVSKQSGFITSGHGRLLAAYLKNWGTVPVNYQDYQDDAQEYADVIADNAAASWAELDLSAIQTDLKDLGENFNFDLLGIQDFNIAPVVKKIAGCDEDEVPEVKESRVKPGDIFCMGAHRLMCGDSTDLEAVDKLLEGETAEICFTSPPYADQREYNGETNLSTVHLATFIRTAYNRVKYFVVNLGYSRKNGEVNAYWDDYIAEARNCGLKLLSWNVWDKGEAGSVGNQTAMFAIEHEWIFVFGQKVKDLNRTIPNKYAGELGDHSTARQKDGTLTKQKDRIVSEFGQLKTILHQSPQKARNHDIKHPAMFPVKFPEAYIEALTQTGEAVFEPFGGSGSTLIACEKTDRKCFVMEIDPKYCAVILNRYCKYSRQEAYLQNDDGTQTAWTDLSEVEEGVSNGEARA